jgi:hypothetical protein
VEKPAFTAHDLQTGLHPVVSEEDEYFVTVTDNEAGGIALTQREV